jgi:hypothetical protein
MPAVNDDEEITHGPKKSGLKDFMNDAGFVAAGIVLFWLGISKFNEVHHIGVFRNSADWNLIVCGVILAITGIVRPVQLILVRRDVPNVTMYSTGISYAMKSGPICEARWDSVGLFELIYNYDGSLHAIEAPITGENISDNLRKENKFSIFLYNPLDVEPTVLVNEVNQVRANALCNRKSAMSKS